jgi:hypothetical protein
MRLQLVLLDHHWMYSGIRESVADPATGALLVRRLREGRAAVLHSAAGRQALIEAVVIPLVRRYGPRGARADLSGQLLAWELMNEPDFIIEEWERDVGMRVKAPLPFESAADLVAAFSRAVHAHSPALATIGCARWHNLWAWDDDALGLDVLHLHTYPDLRLRWLDRDVFGTPAAALGVRRPVVLGEFPCNARERHPKWASPPPHTMDDYLGFAVSGGYLGAWPWSFTGNDAYGPMPEEPLLRFARAHPELVNARGRE